ncbi:MAG: hypothetical protein IT582_09590 [Opitutaceae bacterium]|nr:hypothetical protein [Opitutaceae bacterium]
MLTNLEIPDHILKHAKRRAVEEGVSLRDVIAQTLTDELTATPFVQPAPWRVPVAPHDMGWRGLNETEIQQALEVEREEILLHRAGLKTRNRRDAQH